jgi:hypothetical protein
MVAEYLARESNAAALKRRLSRLSAALAGLASELATARREIALLKRENRALRFKLDAQDSVDAPPPARWELTRPRGHGKRPNDDGGKRPSDFPRVARARERGMVW